MGKRGERGIIGTFFLIIMGLALLKYFFDWSIFDAAASAEGKGTIDYIRQVLNFVWFYLETPVKYIWNEVLWPLLSMLLNRLQNN